MPEEAINPGMAPGQCWAFAGSQGFLVLELSHTIIVTGFTMEHISRLLSPSGRIDSAPKKFSMWVSIWKRKLMSFLSYQFCQAYQIEVSVFSFLKNYQF